jgi:hypothetical protein
MGAMFRSLIFWLVLAFTAGLVLALLRVDLGHIVRPAIGAMMIVAGLFFIFGRVFEGPRAGPAIEHALRRWQTGFGTGQIILGVSQLLPMGWWSTACGFLGVAVMIGTHLATRGEMKALRTTPSA